MSFETAIFAGGCFWCMVEPFDTYPGIEKVESGYTGGHVENPTYEQVKTGTTGHTEAVRITFDPAKVSYEQLVEIYWHQTDPTDAMGQFQDRGDNYRPVIFVKDDEQRQIAETSRQKLADSGIFDDPIVTKITAVITGTKTLFFLYSGLFFFAFSLRSFKINFALSSIFFLFLSSMFISLSLIK